MPDGIKYSTTVQSSSLQKGNVAIGIGNVGPTSTTSFYSAPVPASGKYIVSRVTASGVPNFFAPSDEAEMIKLAKQEGATGANTASLASCLAWFASQANYSVSNFDYENIVTDGLTLSYDAGFANSYPTTGTTWYDLSGKGYNGTINNSPIFSTNYSGGFIFDGSDDYVSNGKGFTSLGMGNSSYTAEIWYYRNSTNGADQTLFGCQATGTGYGLHLILRGNYPYFGHYSADTSAVTTTTLGFFQVSFVFNKTADLLGDQLIYINGSLNVTGTSKAALFNTDTYPVNIGGLSYWGYYAGNIYIARIYNRALSATEVLQNYNAQKGRFGL